MASTAGVCCGVNAAMSDTSEVWCSDVKYSAQVRECASAMLLLLRKG
jgi:hypothetical protein